MSCCFGFTTKLAKENETQRIPYNFQYRISISVSNMYCLLTYKYLFFRIVIKWFFVKSTKLVYNMKAITF